MSSCHGSSRGTLWGTTFERFKKSSRAGLKNGALLREAEAAGFVVLVTGDQNLEYQQNLTKRTLGVVVLGAASNAPEDLLPLAAAALTAIDSVQPGQVIRVTR